MGRMKELYIDIMNRYGEVPVDIDIIEYKRKKDLENAEWKAHEEKIKREENSSNDENLDDTSSINQEK